MRRFLIIPLLAFALAGCATIANPVSSTNIHQAKLGYASTLELVVKWREFCWARTYAALMADPVAKPICRNRRPRLRAIQLADIRAFNTIVAAENFVTSNPTLNAASAVSAAVRAVSDFKQTVPVVN